MSVRVATFNVENLMARFDFSGWGRSGRRDRAMELVDIRSVDQFRALEQARVIAHADDTRQMTALAIADARADIICLQEVENLETLAAFENHYLGRMFGLDYPIQVWRQGNDGRGIDVALLARERTADGTPIELEEVVSHREVTFDDLGLMNDPLREMGVDGADRVFRRDLLEVNLRIGGRRSTIFVAHLKSMGPFRDGMEGRAYTHPVRRAEADATCRIVRTRFRGREDRMRWLVCGDLNDYGERLRVSGSRWAGFDFHFETDPGALDSLFEMGENLIGRRAKHDRWTMFHASGPQDPAGPEGQRTTQHLAQLDYILASPHVARTNPEAVPQIVRSGLPYRTPFPEGQDVDRYPRTGWDRPKGSDHCPVVVDLDFV